MIRELVQVKMSKEYKDEIVDLVNKTIDTVAKKHNYELTSCEKNKVKNLCFDQVNIHISERSRAKTFWTFDTERSIPIVIEKEESQPKLDSDSKRKTGSYKMKPNLTWTYSKKNNNEGGVEKEIFEERVREMLLEDFETAAFYGALSYTTESDINE